MSAVSPQRQKPSPGSAASANQGSLLLWLEGGVVYSLNRMATLIWQQLENNPNGVELSQIVADIGEQCRFSTDGPFKEMFRRDVAELLAWFEERGVVKKKISNAIYQINGTTFRAEDGSADALYDE